MNSCVTFKHLVRFGSESSQRPLCVGHPDTIWPIVIIPSDLGRDILLSWYHPTNMWLFSKETLTILTANIMSIFTADCPKYWHLHHTFFSCTVLYRRSSPFRQILRWKENMNSHISTAPQKWPLLLWVVLSSVFPAPEHPRVAQLLFWCWKCHIAIGSTILERYKQNCFFFSVSCALTEYLGQ